MLERTAAGLESCSLQRVLPKSTKRCRQLHTGFWQHGASALDLSSVWPNSPRILDTEFEPEPEDADSNPRRLQSSLIASAFLLDFLYPSVTQSLLRRLYPSLPRTQDGSRSRSVVLRRRPFSSSSVASDPLDSERTKPAELAILRHEHSVQTASQGQNHAGDVTGTQNSLHNADQNGVGSTANEDQHGSAGVEGNAGLEALNRFLLHPTGNRYEEVWDLYNRLDHDQRTGVRGLVVQYLAKTHRIVETGRAISVFRQIPIEEWDDDLLTAGVLLFLRSGDTAYAIDRFKTGLETKGLSGGLEYVLAHTLTSRQWSSALDVWVAYYAAQLKKRAQDESNTRRLQQLRTIPGQGNLYFAFRDYLATDGAEHYQKIKSSPVSYSAFRAFRRHFASMALWQPCAPEQAAIILDNLNDNGLYNTYFTRMFDRWYEKLEPKTNILKLPEIYQKFREIPDAKPSLPVLRGMFKVHYPKNITALEQIYHDWMRSYGNLNQWGFEKFLKLYAHRGDVQTVQSLWKRYVADYPDVLGSPRAFRSTLNVYAQAGDVKGVENELSTMTEQYGVQPDVDCWNTLLKSYMRVNDYEGVLRCYHNICEIHKPDSFTFAHVMAMSAKKGDLEATLDFFNRSQMAQVMVTKEMALALVIAYCQNDLLLEAETLCAELSERKLTHTAIWNQLLHFNGVAGNIDKVYSLLQRMKDHGVEWDDETYALLLQALVRVNQIHPAYTLLKKADEEKLFTVTPEHFAIVMAGAARSKEYALVESLHRHLTETKRPMAFSGIVALVEAAVKRKPGADRTLAFGRSLVENMREALAVLKREEPSKIATGGSMATVPGDISKLRNETHSFGRAVMLLVELRDFGTVEELISLYTELFPQYKQDSQFPPNVVSALMLAHYKDGNLDKIMELWAQTWQRVWKESRRTDGDGVFPAHAYDISRVLSIVLRVYHDLNDPKALSDCIDRVTSAGFKLTRANWALAIRYLADMGYWERAMYWCETMLMPGWRGWNPERTHKQKRGLLNTRLLRAPKLVVFMLQQEWLKMRKMAAWSQAVSLQLRNVQERFPRLHHAFTTSSFETLPTPWQITDSKVPIKDLDKLLQSMPYRDLMKIKEALLKELMRERNRSKYPSAASQRKRSPEDHLRWKRELHSKVRRYAALWAKRRAAQAKGLPSPDVLPPEQDPTVDDEHDPEKLAAEERRQYWESFWERYDQRPHQAHSHKDASNKKTNQKQQQQQQRQGQKSQRKSQPRGTACKNGKGRQSD